MLSPEVLAIVYNNHMAKKIMLESLYLFQPRGPHTAYLFRMATPAILLGRTNPRTGKPYGKAIREGLGRARNLSEARRLRDLRLGEIRAEELDVVRHGRGGISEALDIAASLEAIEDQDERETLESALSVQADQLEKKIGEKRAVRWYKAATGERTPFSAACDQYKADPGIKLSKSSRNNLDTVIKEFKECAGADVSMQEVDRRLAAKFITQFLPNRRGPKAKEGQGPATIRKKASQLGQVWVWARRRGVLPYESANPWDAQAPTAKDARAVAAKFRPFTPEETQQLLKATSAGEALGDIVRVVVMTGVRLEEVAGLDAAQVEPEARWYTIERGKTENAARIVPLVGMAQEVIKARLKKAGSSGPLFPELKVRKSSGRRGGSISQAFTRLRRSVLGKHTDGLLKEHSFRHLWRTAARRAGVDTQTIVELGGWSAGKGAEQIYDHGLEIEEYRRSQETIADWLCKNGYIDRISLRGGYDEDGIEDTNTRHSPVCVRSIGSRAENAVIWQ